MICLTAIVEISRGSRLKYEVNKKTGRLALDRVLHGSQVYPYNYGYIENTLDGDGDPLDAVIVSHDSLMPGIEVPIRVIGAMKMIDSGERDTKLITVIAKDPRYEEWKTLEDVPAAIPREIQDFFQNYKLLEKKEVKIEGWIKDQEELKKLIKSAHDLHASKAQ